MSGVRGERPSAVFLDDHVGGRRREAICDAGGRTVIVDAPAATPASAVLEAARAERILIELYYWR